MHLYVSRADTQRIQDRGVDTTAPRMSRHRELRVGRDPTLKCHAEIVSRGSAVGPLLRKTHNGAHSGTA